LPSNISSRPCLIVSQWFFARLPCWDWHPFYIRLPLTTCFMPMKWGLLLPDLKENTSTFYTGTFLPLQLFTWLWLQKRASVPLIDILLIVHFLHCLNLPFPFPIVYARSLHPRSSVQVHAWPSRWVPWWFFDPIQPSRFQRPGACLFLTFFRLLGQRFCRLDRSFVLLHPI
jgi:hypothetical protein